MRKRPTRAAASKFQQRRRQRCGRILRSEPLESRMLLASDFTGAVFQNPINPLDVSDDGSVSPRDALMVIGALNTHGSHAVSESAAGEPDTLMTASGSLTSYVDVNGDSFVDPVDALMVIRSLNGEGEPGDVVTFRLEATDLNGNVISTLDVGEEFDLTVLVQDTQPTAEFFGVFSAFLDIEFDPNLVTVVGTPQFTGEFVNGTAGDTSFDGLIDELGGFAGLTPTGQGELPVATLRMRADAAGSLQFTSNPADNLPANDVLVYDSNDPVLTNDILYGSTTLQVVSQQQPATDLVGFAQALTDAGVELWSTQLSARARIAEQLELFEDGEAFLPFNEALDEDLEINSDATAAGVSFLNTWLFPDGTRSEGPLLTLEQISQRSGVPIPTGVSPAIAPIADVTVLEGSPLHIPLDGYDPNGDPLTYTVTLDDGTLLETFIPQNNRSLQINASDSVGTYGDMIFELYEGRASRATEQIIALAQSGFYDGLSFHRVISDFVIQGGDPNGNGTGGSSLDDFDDQFQVDLQHNRSGILSMAKSADDTNNSQFFITDGETRFLDFNHTIFGQLIEGDRVRESIANTEVNPENDQPLLPVLMNSVTVFEDTENAVLMLKALQSTGTTNVTVTATDSAGNSSSESFAVTLGEDTSNGQPFLDDIDDQVFASGDTLEFQVGSTDVEGDPVRYEVFSSDNTITPTVSDQGLVQITTPDGFAGTFQMAVRVLPADGNPQGAFDDQIIDVTIAADAPTGVDLLPVSDLGLSDSDNITSVTDLQFEVSGVASGAFVEILADGVVVGEGTATSNTITITTSNPSALGEGNRVITARQTIGENQTAESPSITLTLDQTVPVAITNAAPGTGEVDVAYTFDPNHPEEGTTGFVYSLGASPTGMTVDPVSGQIDWTPVSDQVGQSSVELILTDLAGNARTEMFDITVEGSLVRFRLVPVDGLGNPVSVIALGRDFSLQVFVEDLRSDPQGITAAFLEMIYDGSAVEVDGNITFGSSFPDNNIGNTLIPGIIDDFGGSTTEALGAGEFLLAGIPFLATAIDTFEFVGDFSASSPIELFGSTTPVSTDEVTFQNTTLSVIAEGAEVSAGDDTATVDEDSTATRLAVLANDQLSVSSESLQITSVSAISSGGTVDISSDGHTLIYTPAADFFGTETFVYTIEDDLGATATATVTVTVNAVNDPPAPADDVFPDDFEPGDSRIVLLVEDATTQPIGLPVIQNDSQEPDSDLDGSELFTITGVGTEGTAGTVSPELLGVNYTLAPDFFGTDTFTYTVTDQHDPALSATATVTVVVAEVNDSPAAVNDSFDVATNTPLTITADQLVGNDSTGPANEAEQTLRIVEVFGAGSGSVVLNGDGTVTYTPSNGFTGPDSFSYRIEDNGTSRGAPDPLQAIGTVTLNVGVGNAPPTAFDDTATVVGDSDSRLINVLVNDRDSDGDSLSIDSVSAGSQGGTIAISNGQISYRPATGFIGTESFTYVVSDGSGTDEGQVMVTVTDPANSTNSSFSGAVFFDLNNNGIQDPGELGISNVPIVLEGTDANDQEVSIQTFTDGSGTYQFSSLPIGNFSVRQEQPDFLLDGLESSSSGSTIAGNDTFSLSVGADLVVSEGNGFAERGLSPRLSMLESLASRRGESGFLTSTADGQSQWIRNAEGWDALSSINVALSDDLQEVTITGIDENSVEVSATVSAQDRSQVQLLGRSGASVMLQIVAAASEFNFQPTSSTTNDTGSGEDSINPAAVDQVFADQVL